MAPRLILHIGMGKTGTTSLQHALAASGDVLASQKARYLGMGFDPLGPNFAGAQGLMAIARAAEPNRVKQAERYGAELQRQAERDGITTFVLSNEALFQRPGPMAPFLTRLAQDVELSVLAYLRPPRDWLPSAYAQWGLRHKTQPGPVRPFQELAPMLLKTYAAIKTWQATFGAALTVRAYDPAVDIVTDFAAATGLALTAPAERHLPRGEAAELVLRALFNDRHPQPMPPGSFNRSVLHRMQNPPPSVERMASMAVDISGIDTIIAEQGETFAFIEREFGLDMKLGQGGEAAAPVRDTPDEAFKDRLIDYLVELTLTQSQRLTRLEKAMEALEQGRSEGE